MAIPKYNEFMPSIIRWRYNYPRSEAERDEAIRKALKNDIAE